MKRLILMSVILAIAKISYSKEIPNSHPDAFIVVPYMSKVEFVNYKGNDEMNFELETSSWEAMTKEIDSTLIKNGWSVKKEDFMNQAMPTSYGKPYNGSTWIGQWINNSGDIVVYGFRPKMNSQNIIGGVAIHYSASRVRLVQDEIKKRKGSAN